MTITNSYSSGSVLNTETVSETTQGSAEEGKEDPKTGDETPVMRYVIIMTAALVVLLAGVLVKVKRKKR